MTGIEEKLPYGIADWVASQRVAKLYFVPDWLNVSAPGWTHVWRMQKNEGHIKCYV